ncbi:MAG: exodeoxyribonuclease V subunit alpha [Lachnospiraceae bacterium]|nr:exodeoxyribonuclease V subunit alpha [Lachnospiraceae bacterium]
MKKIIAKNIQKFLKSVAVNSVGRSIPYTIYEKKVPSELSEELLIRKRKMNEDG